MSLAVKSTGGLLAFVTLFLVIGCDSESSAGPPVPPEESFPVALLGMAETLEADGAEAFFSRHVPPGWSFKKKQKKLGDVALEEKREALMKQSGLSADASEYDALVAIMEPGREEIAAGIRALSKMKAQFQVIALESETTGDYHGFGVEELNDLFLSTDPEAPSVADVNSVTIAIVEGGDYLQVSGKWYYLMP